MRIPAQKQKISVHLPCRREGGRTLLKTPQKSSTTSKVATFFKLLLQSLGPSLFMAVREIPKSRTKQNTEDPGMDALNTRMDVGTYGYRTIAPIGSAKDVWCRRPAAPHLPLLPVPSHLNLQLLSLQLSLYIFSVLALPISVFCSLNAQRCHSISSQSPDREPHAKSGTLHGWNSLF
jgi:hypothetical protein